MTDDTKPIEHPDADEAWFAELSDSAVEPTAATAESTAPSQVDFAGVPYLPPLDRARPERAPLVPRWAILGAVATALAILLIGAASLFFQASRSVTVPDVIGLSMPEAATRLEGAELLAEVAERRFSTQVAGTVLEQDPPAGEELSQGDPVRLVISAGSEDLVMPDVIGAPVAQATSQLEQKGLVVSVETLVSEAPVDTVLASTPAPGASVRTGDRVVLQVAASSAPGIVLQPYDLTAVAVTIDAAPPVAGGPDVSMEVARRVGALLEASGATVTMLRSTADTATTEADRAQRAREATSTLAVGFDLSRESTPGRVVQSPSQGSAQAIAASSLLASSIASELVPVAPPVSSVSSSVDPVLSASQGAWVRVLLGSPVEREDQGLFSDPSWADKVARGVYTAIGKSYGVVR